MTFHQNKHNLKKITMQVGLFFMAALTAIQPGVQAQSTYDAQINATQGEVATYEQEQVRLQAYAATLEEELNQLRTQLGEVQAQISENQAKYDLLANDILFQEADVKAKGKELGAVLRQAYIDSDVSPLEMLASNRGLSYYMDYYEARDRIQSRLTEHLKELKAAKRELANQQKKVAVVLRDGKAMRDTLLKKQTEQERLLQNTRGQQQRYVELIAARNQNIAQLRGQQLSANQSYFSNGQLIPGDPGRGGYPDVWHFAPQDSLVDSWGMFNRECVSYTAWKVHQSGKRMPYWGGRGNANQWPSSAQQDGIQTGNTPRVGAVAIAFIGPYGHSMYVEEVHSDGKIRVSEYNYRVDGQYTERIISSSNLTYVYFQ